MWESAAGARKCLNAVRMMCNVRDSDRCNNLSDTSQTIRFSVVGITVWIRVTSKL